MFIIFKIRKVHVYKNEIVFETGIYFEVLEDLKYPILKKKSFQRTLPWTLISEKAKIELYLLSTKQSPVFDHMTKV